MMNQLDNFVLIIKKNLILAYLNKINHCIPKESNAQETYNYVFCNMERYNTSWSLH
jgi:hypothetical protein